ncbi:hypothetical protein TRVL_00686 [Trypanosoma vivax]|uniref:PPPDE domain-containing protein n=1 Tax=Trypanosoma vivax (strain Y486) TaxID=1055687 RepID=G0U8W3_TRYVY|nr:hypothetical protein TRVL_00686 [Trypanosoma vivax]CCC54045.1 conserved hypothetical protein [Trypanosoma vivax Y486]
MFKRVKPNEPTATDAQDSIRPVGSAPSPPPAKSNDQSVVARPPTAGSSMPTSAYHSLVGFISSHLDGSHDELRAGVGEAAEAQADSFPPLLPPENSRAGAVVSSCMSFVLSTVRRNPRLRFDVFIHIYPLDRGFVSRHSKDLIGVEVHGIHHSAVVCYGMEFFFEGGIGVTSKGCTRFGKEYQVVPVGSTAKQPSEFYEWLYKREGEMYEVWSYHVSKHNCHDFTIDAVTFLTGSADSVPSHLKSDVDTLVSTPVGAAARDIILHFIKGQQYMLVKVQRNQLRERQIGGMCARAFAKLVGLATVPPQCVVLFHMNNAKSSRRALLSITSYAEQLICRGVLNKASLEALRDILVIADGVESVDPSVVSEYIAAVSTVLVNTHRTLWGPVLNGLRVAVLNKMVLCACVFHPFLLGVIANGVRDFINMTADGKLALLRFLCNLASGMHGALALNCTRYADTWVSVAGLALMEYRHTAIVYAGAALTVNLALVFVLLTRPTLSEQVAKSVQHPSMRLVTVLLFFLGYWPKARVPEPVLNMMLLALHYLTNSCLPLQSVVKNHIFQLKTTELTARALTDETKMLVVLQQCFQVEWTHQSA